MEQSLWTLAWLHRHKRKTGKRRNGMWTQSVGIPSVTNVEDTGTSHVNAHQKEKEKEKEKEKLQREKPKQKEKGRTKVKERV